MERSEELQRKIKESENIKHLPEKEQIKILEEVNHLLREEKKNVIESNKPIGFLS